MVSARVIRFALPSPGRLYKPEGHGESHPRWERQMSKKTREYLRTLQLTVGFVENFDIKIPALAVLESICVEL